MFSLNSIVAYAKLSFSDPFRLINSLIAGLKYKYDSLSFSGHSDIAVIFRPISDICPACKHRSINFCAYVPEPITSTLISFVSFATTSYNGCSYNTFCIFTIDSASSLLFCLETDHNCSSK